MTNVAAGLLRNNVGELLICRRLAHREYAGKMEFPGGKLENNESYTQCLVRELEEELSIMPVWDAIHPLLRVKFTWGDLIFYLVEKWAGIPKCLDHEEILWESPEKILLRDDLINSPMIDVLWALKKYDDDRDVTGLVLTVHS